MYISLILNKDLTGIRSKEYCMTMENSNEIFRNFMLNQVERIGLRSGNLIDLTLEKCEEELIELLTVIQSLKKIEMIHKLKIIDFTELYTQQKKCFGKLCEEMSHVTIAVNYLGSSIDESFDELVSEEKMKKLKYMKDITDGNIQ